MMDDEMVRAAEDALRNERIVMGESVFRFEEEFAEYVGTKRAVSVSSGTDALILALRAVGVEGGDVITTPLTFIASANSATLAGGRPVFADVRGDDNNIDPERVREKLTDRTRCVLPVHLFGHPARVDELEDIVGDVPIVEDAAQAHGAALGGRNVGTLGTLGCFSFYPTKNMNVGGDGGMVTTDDEGLADLVAKLRDCGRTSRYEHDVVGYTARLNTVNAAIGRVQLRRLDAWNARRADIASRYDDALRGVSGLELPPSPDDRFRPVHHLYAVRCPDRDALAEHLSSKGVATAIHYPLPVHLQPAYSGLGHARGDFPVAESLSDRLLSLPMSPDITDDEVSVVIEAVLEFFGR